MIATTPVARWAWGRDDDTADDLTRCLRDALAALAVLARHRFAPTVVGLRVSVKEAGASNSYLFRGEIPVETEGAGAGETVARVADQVRAVMSAGEIGAVDASVTCGGSVVTGHAEELSERLFLLGASAFAGFVTVDLVTFADVWLPYDLKGRPQPEVYAANGPRLAAVLGELAEVLDSETDPDDPTYFAKPTESFGRIGYRRTAEGEVRYLPVESERGLLGYLWASDGEKAASFEPVNVGDDIVYHAGLVWLERLESAHARGLSPAAAFEELSRLPDEGGAGRVLTSEPPRTTRLDVLRESADSD
ncbi:hypothetical protein [Streptomyces sp. NRRL F-6676]|uniref:hypothetical protein n=1 Tax=Streptomyces sp. NRRL F-6676 TaxID=1463878 RepID=UPI0005603D5C|nr:hypothetical protein [Streptomyces sp. NRRL F-6676]